MTRRRKQISPSRAGGAVPAATRRQFLQRLAAVGAVTAGASVLAGCARSNEVAGGTASGRTASGGTVAGNGSGGPTPGASADQSAAGRLLRGAVDGRILVVVNLEGGNDGLSTLIPAAAASYHDLRPRLAIPDGEVLGLDDRVGLHPSLGRLHKRGIATVEGVGPIDGDLSHFSMTERWERGDATGSNSLRTGFLGRLTDALDDGSPLVGLSLVGPTPTLTNSQAATLSLDDRNQLWFLNNSEWAEATAFQEGIRTLSSNREGGAEALSESYGELLDLAAQLPEVDEEIDWDQPMLSEGGYLGQQLYLAADLIEANVGMRVVYASIGGFDTHDGHEWQHPELLAEVDAAVDGFLERVDDAGAADRVLVATISEFGRRVPESGTGLDHGSASTMLLAGPIANKRFGEPPPLDDLDDDNLRVTVGFDRYLASLAEEWLGVEASSVLPNQPVPLGLLS